MIRLLEVGLSWLGYLQRGSVVLQLLALLAALGLARGVFPRLLDRSRLGRRWRSPVRGLAGPGLALLLSGLLQTARQPWGLLGLCGQLWLGWNLLSLSGPRRR